MLAEACGIEKIILICGYTDLRYGIDGLAQQIGTNYDLSKYKEIIENVDLSELSEKAKWSWGESYEICMIIDCLATADKRFAIAFLNMNQKRIECYYSPMIAIDASSAIEANEKEGIPLELFTHHWWNESLSALKALARHPE